MDAIENHASRRLGTTLRGRYRLDSVLGIGDLAVVYRATHCDASELAVKVLHPELSQREDVRYRFLRDGYAANSVRHPGVVLVVDDDVDDDGNAFIVTELVEGDDCATLCARAGGRLPMLQACTIAHQVLDVLATEAQQDRWSVGAALYTMVTGAPGSRASLGDVLSDTPDALVHFLDRALAADPEERWTNATTMRDALAMVVATFH